MAVRGGHSSRSCVLIIGGFSSVVELRSRISILDVVVDCGRVWKGDREAWY